MARARQMMLALLAVIGIFLLLLMAGASAACKPLVERTYTLSVTANRC